MSETTRWSIPVDCLSCVLNLTYDVCQIEYKANKYTTVEMLNYEHYTASSLVCEVVSLNVHQNLNFVGISMITVVNMSRFIVIFTCC